MPEAMTKADLLAAMRRARTHWDALLARCAPQRAVQPGADGIWSIKDVIAHIAAYERHLAFCLEQLADTGGYQPLAIRSLPVEERNARWQEADRMHSLGEVQGEAQRVFARLLQAIEQFSEEELQRPEHFQGLVVDEPPWKAFAGESYEHYEEHRAAVERWGLTLDKD